MSENARPGGRRRPWWKRNRPACRRNRPRRWTRQSVHQCTPEQHAYTVQCTEDGHVLHWVRVEKHQWSDWQVEKEPDCEDPGELRSTCAVCGMVRWQRLAPLGHLLQFKPEDERHTIAVCRVCGRTLWRGPARDAAQKKKAARRSRSSTRNAAK